MGGDGGRMGHTFHFVLYAFHSHAFLVICFIIILFYFKLKLHQTRDNWLFKMVGRSGFVLCPVPESASKVHESALQAKIEKR